MTFLDAQPFLGFLTPATLVRVPNHALTSPLHPLVQRRVRPNVHLPVSHRSRLLRACAEAGTSTAEPQLPGAPAEWAALLTGDELMGMVRGEVSEARINEVVRGLLGWRGDDASGWDVASVPKAWAEVYGEKPPDFIGDPNDYSPAKDRPVKLAMQKLTREIADPYKRGLKEFGFKGYKIHELTPNKTRRATAVNWILYYLKSRKVGIFADAD